MTKKALQRMAKFWENAKNPLLNLIPCGFYVADVVTDILLAISFYENGDVWYFSLTLTFVLLSTIASNIFSFRDSYDELSDAEKPKIHYVWVTLLHCCSLGVLYRYTRAIRCGISKPDIKYSEWSVILMGIFEIVLESGPQLILQLYILIANTQIIDLEFQTDDYVGISKRNSTVFVGDDDFLQKLTSTTMIFQVASIVTSLSSIALLCSKADSEGLWKGHICYFIWHVFSIGARIFAVSLFASVYTFWTPVIIVCRCFIIGVGYYICVRVAESFGGDLCHGILIVSIYIFSYIELSEASWAFAIIYFTYDLIENSILVGLWCWVIDSASNKFLYLALSVYISCVGFGFLFMVIYLKYFFKNKEQHSDNNSDHSESEIEITHL